LYNTVPNGSTGTILYTDGSSTEISLSTTGIAAGFEIHLVASESNGKISFRKYEGAIKNVGGTVSIVGSITELIVAEDLDLVRVSISVSGTSLRVSVGDPGSNGPIKVSAYVRWTQVIY
jgi:hypothetical protein